MIRTDNAASILVVFFFLFFFQLFQFHNLEMIPPPPPIFFINYLVEVFIEVETISCVEIKINAYLSLNKRFWILLNIIVSFFLSIFLISKLFFNLSRLNISIQYYRLKQPCLFSSIFFLIKNSPIFSSNFSNSFDRFPIYSMSINYAIL